MLAFQGDDLLHYLLELLHFLKQGTPLRPKLIKKSIVYGLFLSDLLHLVSGFRIGL